VCSASESLSPLILYNSCFCCSLPSLLILIQYNVLRLLFVMLSSLCLLIVQIKRATCAFFLPRSCFSSRFDLVRLHLESIPDSRLLSSPEFRLAMIIRCTSSGDKSAAAEDNHTAVWSTETTSFSSHTLRLTAATASSSCLPFLFDLSSAFSHRHVDDQCRCKYKFQ